MGTTWDGFFKAPASGEYRFYISCEANCKLDLDSLPLEEDHIFEVKEIAHRNQKQAAGKTGMMRNYFQYNDDSNSYISDWMELEEGKHYKIAGMMKNKLGVSHFTTSVEYRKNGQTFEDHSKAMR